MSKNICFFNSNRAWGGGEKWHFETAQYLKNLGFSCFVYAYKDKELFKRALSVHLSTFPVVVKGLSFLNPFKVFALASEFKEKNIDTIILNLSSDVKTAGLAAKLAGVKNIMYRRGLAVKVKKSFINRFLFKNIITHFICNSIDIQGNITSNYPFLLHTNKLHIIFNGVDVKNYPGLAERRQAYDAKLVIGSVGRLVAQKAQHYLVDLAVLLKNNDINAEIRIAGSGELEDELKEGVRLKNVSDYIVFQGFESELDRFYSTIDVFILTSLHEGTSNAAIEAMAWGKPMLAFNVSSMPEMIVHGENGYLCEVGDINTMFLYIKHLVNNTDEIPKMGNKSIQLVHEKFSKEKNLQKLVELIEKN